MFRRKSEYNLIHTQPFYIHEHVKFKNHLTPSKKLLVNAEPSVIQQFVIIFIAGFNTRMRRVICV